MTAAAPHGASGEGAEPRRARLPALVRECALKFGDFTLASGPRSSFYLDGRLVTLHHEGAYLTARVIVVDDVVTTAGSTLAAIRAVEEIGATVEAVICLIDRQEGGGEALAGYRFYPLFALAEVLPSSSPRS